MGGTWYAPLRARPSLVTQYGFLSHTRSGERASIVTHGLLCPALPRVSARLLEGTSGTRLRHLRRAPAWHGTLGRKVGSEKTGDLHVNLRVKSAISPEARYLDLLAKATLSKRDLAC